MQYEKLDIVNLVVVIGLVISLVMAIIYDRNELSTNIAVGLLGWLGGVIKTTAKDNIK
jgi:hypothetical protein